MHRLSSHSVVRRYRIASVLFLLVWVGFPTALCLAGFGILKDNRDLLFAGGVLAGVSVVLALVFFVLAARLRCPLCIVQPMQSRSCSRHRSARKALFSYRLKVALSIVSKGNFRCPYCGELTVMEVRTRNKRR